jgi:hypothetical protein
LLRPSGTSHRHDGRRRERDPTLAVATQDTPPEHQDCRTLTSFFPVTMRSGGLDRERRAHIFHAGERAGNSHLWVGPRGKPEVSLYRRHTPPWGFEVGARESAPAGTAMRVFDVREALDSILEIERLQSDGTGVMTLTSPPEVMLKADRRRFERAIENLLTNAQR